MSLIPDHLILKNGLTQADILQLPNGNLAISTTNVLQLNGGAGTEVNVLLSVAGNDPLDNPIKYSFPDVNIAMPAQDQIISFNSDGTSQFINNGGGGGAVNAVLNTAYPTPATAGSVLVMDGTDAVSSSPSDAIIVNAGITTITGGVNIVGGTSANNIYKDGFNQLTLNGDNNVYLNSSAGSTFIQSTGGNINLDAPSGVIQCNSGINVANGVGSSANNIYKDGTTLSIRNPSGNISFVNDGDSMSFTNYGSGGFGFGSLTGDFTFNSSGAGAKLNVLTGMQVSGITNFNNNIVMNDNKVIVLKDPATALESLIAQNTIGVTTITNNKGMLLTTGGGAGLALTETDTNLGMNIGNGKGNAYIQTTADTQSLILSIGGTDPTNSITLQSPSVNVINSSGLLIKDTVSNFQSNIQQQDDGDFKILNENGNILLQSQKGVNIGNTVSAFTSKIFADDVGDLLVNNSNGNINLESLGTVNINRINPKLNFNNTDYPTQQCNIEFKSATQEFVIEHHSPDDAAKCNIRLGKNDINIETGLIQPGDIKLRTGGSGQTFINDYNLPNVNPTEDGQILTCTIAGVSSWETLKVPQITYTFWVSNQGNDTFNGTIVAPFATIARALVQANTLAQTDKVIINVMAGTYNEGALSITKNNITINGGTPIPSQTVINAVITHTIDNTAGALIASSLYALTVRGVVYAGSSVYDGSYVIGACIIGTTESGIIPFVNSYSLAGNRDITVSNCVLYAYDTAGLTTVSGRVNCTATLFTQVALFTNIYPVLQATGNGLFALFGCQVFSLNNTNQAPPIISLANTVAPSSSHTFNSCTIQYIFNTVNIAPLNKVAIGCTNTVGISMLAYNNLIISEGTRITNSGAQYVIISKQGTGSLVITYGQNLCGATANHYPAAASRTQLITATN